MSWKKILLNVYFGLLSSSIIIMMLLVMVQVVGRYFFAISPLWIEEIVAYILVFSGLLGSSYAFYQKKHIALTFLQDKISSPIGKKWLAILIDFMVFLFAALVQVVGGGLFFLQTMGLHSPGQTFPVEILHILLPISGIIIMILLGISIVEKIRGEN